MKSRNSPWNGIVVLLLVVSMAGCNLGRVLGIEQPSVPTNNPPPGNSNHPPVSSIVLPYAARVDQVITVQNRATDPDGDAISMYRFRSAYQDFTQPNNIAGMSFPAAGRFAVSVSAQDSRNTWSAEVSDSITITANPPGNRVLFLDDGSLDPVALGYGVAYPANGDFRITVQGGQRVMSYNYGNQYSAYGPRDWLDVPRGAHLRFSIFTQVDTDPVWQTAADCRGYVAFDMVFGRDGNDTGAHYYELATLPLLSDGFPGTPDHFENYLVPGKHVFDRAPTVGSITKDIDLDALVRTRYNSSLNLQSFNQIWFNCEAFTFPAGLEKVYRLTLTVDDIEVYVPGNTNTPAAIYQRHMPH